MHDHSMSTNHRTPDDQLRAWGIKRKTIDVDKLALAYYLLAKAIVEDERQTKLVAKQNGSASEDEKAA